MVVKRENQPPSTGCAGAHDVRGHSGGHIGISSALQIFWDGSYTMIVLDNYGLGHAVAGEIVGLLAAQTA